MSTALPSSLFNEFTTQFDYSSFSNNSSFSHQSIAFEKCRVVEETVAMDLADSAVMAVEGNLPKPLKLLGNFHYVYPLLAVVETNVVVVVFFFFFFPYF